MPICKRWLNFIIEYYHFAKVGSHFSHDKTILPPLQKISENESTKYDVSCLHFEPDTLTFVDSFLLILYNGGSIQSSLMNVVCTDPLFLKMLVNF